jgi:hypothetical protein
VLKQNDRGVLGGIEQRVQLAWRRPPAFLREALVLDSKIAVNVFRRWGLEVQVNPYAGDEFKANQFVIRAETRFGVRCIYPKVVCKVTGLFS